MRGLEGKQASFDPDLKSSKLASPETYAVAKTCFKMSFKAAWLDVCVRRIPLKIWDYVNLARNS